MQSQTCLMSIRHKFHTLTPAEKRIAEYVLDHGSEVTQMSISQLSEACSVAKSAVLRFCKSVGFAGYPALKLALSAEYAQNTVFNFTPYLDPEDTSRTVLDKIFAANVKTLHSTAENMDRAALEAVVDAMEQARTIYIYGVGTSAALCSDFQYRLTQIGKIALCFTDVPSMKVSTLNVTPQDFVIGISHSGRTVPTIEAVRLSGERGAVTACLTSFPHSPIVSACDLPLCIYSDEVNYPIEALSSRIAHISVMDTITVALSSRHYEEAVRRAQSTREFVENIRY